MPGVRTRIKRACGYYSVTKIVRLFDKYPLRVVSATQRKHLNGVHLNKSPTLKRTWPLDRVIPCRRKYTHSSLQKIRAFLASVYLANEHDGCGHGYTIIVGHCGPRPLHQIGLHY